MRYGVGVLAGVPNNVVLDLQDGGVVADNVKRGTVKSVWDWLVGEHVPVKGVSSCKFDAGLPSDYYAKSLRVNYADVGLAADFVKRLSLKGFADVGLGLDFIRQAPAKALRDSGLWFDRYGKDVLRAILEWVVNIDWVEFPRMRYVILLDWVVGEHVPVKDVGKVYADLGVGYDWKEFDLSSVLVDAFKGLDRIHRVFPVELRDTFLSELEFGTKRAKVFQEKVKFEELVVKVGFTLMSQEVWRRVYHEVWYDLIEVADQNTKIVIAQALIDAFKALYDKLKG
jgi:hypothetical protein